MPAKSQEELLATWEVLKRVRHKARTNLLYLCREVLGYKDVSQEVHGEIIATLQHFKGGEDILGEGGLVKYTPAVSCWELEGPRNQLILFPRGHLKTTIITIAHTIQWIINYPNIRILMSTATGDQVKKMLNEVKGHFQFNPGFRQVFPDYCPPPKKAGEWGSQEEFTVPNRTVHRKEPTVSTCSVGKVIAGAHYEVIKNSDLVDKENVKTPNQIADVISHFGYLNPLLERSELSPFHGWTDVEGTRYDFGDLYGRLLSAGTWRTLIRPRDAQDSVWPARFPLSELKRIEAEVGPYIFSCQYRNKPIPPEGGLCDPKDVVFLSRSIMRDILPAMRLHCTVDVHGFDRDGRLYILDIRRGRFTPSQFVEQFFDIMRCWPTLIDFKIEKVLLWAALAATLKAEMQKRQKFACIIEIKRDTHTGKQQRIRGLQPWFRSGRIRFAEDLSCKTDVLQEIMEFPSQSSGVHDDVLDTCADALQNEEGEVNYDVVPQTGLDPRMMFGLDKPKDRFLGFGEGGIEQWVYGNVGREKE